MTITHGFELVREKEIAELHSRARLYRHQKTGAELLSLSNDDENKVFGITFRTPPSDSTGVAHILEHGVLAGSRKYPLKEPFVELIKGSLHTFINAFTYPDKTCYPVASTNLQDFYNLIDVYLDAVLHPRLSPQTLQQEGWHYELDSPDEPLRFKGVVFNEMKGNYASPDSLLYEYVQSTLMPDTTYGVDSGGDPRHIPDLTFEQYSGFHARFYHPSNARLFFYGDDPEETRLELVDEYLAEFESLPPDSEVTAQRRWESPREVRREYPVAADATDEATWMVAVSWLLPEVLDVETHLRFRLLDYILIETPGSPLRQALINSGLGEDLSTRGLADHLRQMTFSTGLKGLRAENVDKVEPLIFDTLQALVDEGIDPAMIEAALNATEFALRENNTGNYPRGLAVMLRALTPWLYDGDPLAPLAFEGVMASIRDQLAADERLFESMIEQHFLKNPHRVTLTLSPSPTLAQEWEEAEQARLADARAAMSDEEVAQVIADTQALREAQQMIDPPEVVALIPRLTLEDLEREQKTIRTDHRLVEDTPLLLHPLATNGIVYVDLGLDLHLLPADLLPYGALFGQCLLEMGTSKEDYTRLTQRIARETGGIRTTTLTTARPEEESDAVWLFLRGKALEPQLPELLNIMRDVLVDTKFDDQDRFRQIILERKAQLEASLLPMGHQVIITRMRAHFGESFWAKEQLTNIAQLQFLRQLAQQVEEDWPTVLETLEEIRQLLVNRDAMLLNITVDVEFQSEVMDPLKSFIRTLPRRDSELARWELTLPARHEGFALPAQVNYVGRAADLSAMGYEADGGSLVATRYLRMSYLWEQIRVQGGAYGSFSTLTPRTGLFAYASYRDPNVTNTLDVYAKGGEFLRQSELDDAELTRSIIGTISDLDQYQLPDAKGWTALERTLAGIDADYLQRLRDGVFQTSARDFHALADALDQMNGQAVTAVLGGLDRLQDANEHLDHPLEIQKLK